MAPCHCILIPRETRGVLPGPARQHGMINPIEMGAPAMSVQPSDSVDAAVLTAIAQHVQTLVGAETAVVALAEEDGQSLYYAAAVGKQAAAIVGKRGATATAGLCGVAVTSGQAELVCQTRGDGRVRQDLVAALGIETALAVPISRDGKQLGALMVLNRQDDQPFDTAAQEILTAYAQDVATLL